MVAQFLGLRLRLLANSFAGGAWQTVGLLVGLAVGLVAAILGVTALVELRDATVAVAGDIVAVAGALIVLGYFVIPLAFGGDDAMDPRKFALFDLPAGRLATGLAVAALVSVPSLAIALVAFAQIATWSRSSGASVLAVLSALLIIATCVLGSRVTTAVAALIVASRWARDVAGVVALLVLAVIVVIGIAFLGVDWSTDGSSVLHSIVVFAGWTPFGAAWSAPAEAAAGHGGTATGQTLVALATVAVLWVLWRVVVGHTIVTKYREVAVKKYKGLGWFDSFPSTRSGVIAARTLTYWGRDPRYHVSLLIVPLVPFVMLIPLMVAGVPTNYLALIPVPVVALFLGWLIHNDVAFDNTAVWLHVVSHTRGSADRLGRAIPTLIIGIPIVVFGSFFCAVLFGDIGVLPSLIGVSLCILLSGLGLSSVMSARFPYPVARPGDSPFAQPQTGGGGSATVQAFSFLLTIVVAVPALALARLGLIEGGTWAWGSLWIGIGVGLLVLAVGIAWGGRIFEKRSPDILAFSMRN